MIRWTIAKIIEQAKRSFERKPINSTFQLQIVTWTDEKFLITRKIRLIPLVSLATDQHDSPREELQEIFNERTHLYSEIADVERKKSMSLKNLCKMYSVLSM